MKAVDPHNSISLQRHLHVQKKHQWDLEKDIDWDLGIDLKKDLLPFDSKLHLTSTLSSEQNTVLSQFLGLVVNSTISEMEDALPKLKYHGWEKVLRSYPANPELWDLGEVFFAEEEKHARAFNTYYDQFCNQINLDPKDLKRYIPQTYGSRFQKMITKNAVAGGHAFWWIVALTEEVSIKIYRSMESEKNKIDPLYYQLHRLHMEEESRHANYAYLMLECIQSRAPSFKRLYAKKFDYLFSQLVSTPWILGELSKFFKIQELDHPSDFIQCLKSCIPILLEAPKHQLALQMFYSVPYISWFLNPNWRKHCRRMAAKHGAITPPLPKLQTLQEIKRIRYGT